MAAQKNLPTIEDAKQFCDNMDLENRVRNAIAEIAKKLNRSNLSSEDGIQYAELLKKAYEHLQTVEKALKGESE
jgi:hypothetical protein